MAMLGFANLIGFTFQILAQDLQGGRKRRTTTLHVFSLPFTLGILLHGSIALYGFPLRQSVRQIGHDYDCGIMRIPYPSG